MAALPAPYQDPTYGELPSYGRDGKFAHESAQAAAAAAQEQDEVLTRQDEVMADVYSQVDAMDEHDEGVAGPSGVDGREV